MKRIDSCGEFPQYGDSFKIIFDGDVGKVVFEKNMKERTLSFPESFEWEFQREGQEDFNEGAVCNFLEEELVKEDVDLFVNVFDDADSEAFGNIGISG